jgi:hypothetical protein
MANLTVSGSAPYVYWDDNAGIIQRDWRIRVDGGPMFMEQDISGTWTELFQFSDGGHTSSRDMTISKDTPTLTFDHTSGTDFTLNTDASGFYLKRGATTIAQADSNYLYANNGLGAGNTSSAHVIRWERFTGTLGASPFTITLTGHAGDIIGATVMLTTASNVQNDSTYNLYDYLDATAAANTNFFVQIGRNPASTDTVVITYGTAYTAGSSRYHALVFYDA